MYRDIDDLPRRQELRFVDGKLLGELIAAHYCTSPNMTRFAIERRKLRRSDQEMLINWNQTQKPRQGS